MTLSDKYELLYFEGCPSWEAALGNLEIVLQKLHLDTNVDRIRIETDQEAKDNLFVGSPSIRVNGDDLFPVGHQDYALGCRIYQTPHGMRGWPTEEMIGEALAKRDFLPSQGGAPEMRDGS